MVDVGERTGRSLNQALKRHPSPCCLCVWSSRGKSQQLGRRYPRPRHSALAGGDPGWAGDRRADEQHGRVSYGGQARRVAAARGQVLWLTRT